jgi:transcriptional regulator
MYQTVLNTNKQKGIKIPHATIQRIEILKAKQQQQQKEKYLLSPFFIYASF